MQLSFTFTHHSIQANENKFLSQKKKKNARNDCLGTKKSTLLDKLVYFPTRVQYGAVLYSVGENVLALHERNQEDSTSETAVSLTGHNGWPRSIWMQQQHDIYITSSQWVLSIPPSPWWPRVTSNQGPQPLSFFPLFGCIQAYPDKIFVEWTFLVSVWMRSDQLIIMSRSEENSEDKSAEKSLEKPDDEVCIQWHQVDAFLCWLCHDKIKGL